MRLPEEPATSTTPPGALGAICAETRTRIAAARNAVGLEAMRARALAAPPPRGFCRALTHRVAEGSFALVAEIKRASPSGGLIRADFDPAALAKSYRVGGATCLSVLTEGPHFQGKTEHLQAARGAADLPVLRKDFILDPWQVFESRAIGADCILLIMAALTDTEALELEALARALDMDVLAEVHDREELGRALGLQTPLIGINNRNLKTLDTDLQITLDLAPEIPPERFVISESGIRSHDDLNRLAGVAVHAFLVGEHLMRQPDVVAATRALLEPPEAMTS